MKRKGEKSHFRLKKVKINTCHILKYCVLLQQFVSNNKVLAEIYKLCLYSVD